MTSTEHLISIDSKIQEQDFLGSGEIHPVFVKNNHGIHYVIFYKNHWSHNKCEKLFQKTVGRLFEDNSIEFGRKFLSEYPELKQCKAKLIGRKVLLSKDKVCEAQPVFQKSVLSGPSAADNEDYIGCSAADSYVLHEIAQQNHLAAGLEAIFGKKRAALLLSLSIFLASNPQSSVFEFKFGNSQISVSDRLTAGRRLQVFFEQISESEITAFLRSRLHRTKPESIYWCFHTKSVLSYTELNRLAASGGCGGRFGLSLLNLVGMHRFR